MKKHSIPSVNMSMCMLIFGFQLLGITKEESCIKISGWACPLGRAEVERF
jgi:hypothetical protein